MTQRTDRDRRAAQAGDRRDHRPRRSPTRASGSRRSPRWRRRRISGMPGLGERRSARSANAPPRSQRSAGRCRSCGMSLVGLCASSGSRTCTSSSTTRPSGARASSNSSTSSRPAHGRRGSAAGRDAADPGARVRHEGDPPEEPPSAVIPPKPPRPRPNRAGDRLRPSHRMTSTSRRYLDCRARRVVGAAPRRPARPRGQSTRTPTPTRSGRRSASPASSRRWAAPPTRSAPTRSRRSTTSWPASSGFGRIPTPTATTTCSWSSDCGTLDRVGDVARPPRGAVRAAAAGRHRPPRLERRRPAMADWIEPTPRRPARWSRSSRSGSACRSISTEAPWPPP